MWALNKYKIESWAYVNNIFTDIQCKEIIELGKNLNIDYGTVVGKDNLIINPTIRKSKVSFFSIEKQEHHWIYAKCADLVQYANNSFFNYDLSHIETLQFTSYNQDNEYYGKHIDTLYETGNPRKLSFSIQLSESQLYDGGELLLHINEDPIVAPKDLGTATLFNSNVLHEVTPVTRGIRYSLVGWVTGPKFK
jgi:PKHD-type hydroxylase